MSHVRTTPVETPSSYLHPMLDLSFVLLQTALSCLSCVLSLSLFPSGERHDPICLPGLAHNVGKCLLPATRVWLNVRPDESNKDRFARKFFLVEEFATTILELADHGLFENSFRRIRPVNTPLTRFGVIGSHGHALNVTGGAVRLEFVRVGASSPNRPGYYCSVELNPFVRASEWMH